MSDTQTKAAAVSRALDKPGLRFVNQLRREGAIDDIDAHFAETLGRLTDTTHPFALLGAAIASHAVGQGHVCADLGAIVQELPFGANGEEVPGFLWPLLDEWIEALRDAPFVSDIPASMPLILEGQRLYMARYFAYERMLARTLLSRAFVGGGETVSETFEMSVRRLFPDADTREALQAQAARSAARSRLAIISGGPGTGKTRTVARILALLIEQAFEHDKPAPVIALLAPTGKAAQRLGESIADAMAKMPIDPKVAAAIPQEAQTIHRALGVRMDDPTRFRRDAENPLRADVVLVDEASMVDLSVMARLLDAVPASARVIMLGDRDQLASVEAGAIFGDVCIAGGRDTSPLVQNTVHLTHRFRFKEDSPIGALSEAIRSGDADETLRLLPPGGPVVEEVVTDVSTPLFDTNAGRTPIAPEGVSRVSPPERGNPIRVIEGDIVRGFRKMLEAASPEDALAHLNDYRVLCAHRRGRLGMKQVGTSIEQVLVAAELIPRARTYGQVTDEWYAGRPIMVTQNDYQLDLFNGDVGVAMPSPRDPERMRVWFATADGLRDIQPSRLPPHETCFAMTIHKSQGSEFGEVVVVLPERPSPIGTRELLYTGITRARRRVLVLGNDDVIQDAVRRRIVRASGLSKLL